MGGAAKNPKPNKSLIQRQTYTWPKLVYLQIRPNARQMALARGLANAEVLTQIFTNSGDAAKAAAEVLGQIFCACSLKSWQTGSPCNLKVQCSYPWRPLKSLCFA
jgi:hypothetical protein